MKISLQLARVFTTSLLASLLCDPCALRAADEVTGKLLAATTNTAPFSGQDVQDFDKHFANVEAYGNQVSVTVIDHSGVLYDYTRGGMNRNEQVPTMSICKTVTAALLMTYVEDGKLDINQTVGHYIPSWNGNGKEKVTIRQLLAHTSGVVADSPFDEDITLNLEQTVDKIATDTALKFPPGTNSLYSSCSYKVLGRLIEVASGSDFKTQFETRIRNVSGMGNFVFDPIQNPAPGRGAKCTMNEYIEFMKMLFNKGIYGKTRVLEESSITTMVADHTDGHGGGFGLGIWREPSGGESAMRSAEGHQCWINPGKYLVVIWCRNRFEKTIGPSQEFRNLVRQRYDQ